MTDRPILHNRPRCLNSSSAQSQQNLNVYATDLQINPFSSHQASCKPSRSELFALATFSSIERKRLLIDVFVLHRFTAITITKLHRDYIFIVCVYTPPTYTSFDYCPPGIIGRIIRGKQQQYSNHFQDSFDNDIWGGKYCRFDKSCIL